MNNSDMPAMPNSNPETYPTPCAINYGGGLTKREHFAGLAMQAILSNPSLIDNLERASVDWLVMGATVVADAQLDILDKSK
jgi:hypothetical protein